MRNSSSIALDATYSLDRSPSGVALYSREILYGLAKSHPDTRFDFYYRPHRFRQALSTAAPANVRRRPLLGGAFGDLFHGLNQRLPRFAKGRNVVTFHDLFVLTGDYSTAEFRARFAEQARDAAARADFIITVSEFTRGQVMQLLNIDATRVRAIHHGTRPLVFPSGVARERVILSAGAIQKRKNIARLVEAFEAVDASWRLVVIGSDGYGAAEIHARITSSPARSRIQTAGYVSPEELAAWYARASVFAFPSLDEGFGMPLLEAMAAGVPILTSNRSALPEVAGDAALLVDPYDTDAIAAGLRRLTEDDKLIAELVARGRKRVKQFTWQSAVDSTWATYGELLKQ